MASKRGIRWRCRWGPAYDRELIAGYPLDAAVAGDEPREGSEWAESTAGARDAWILGESGQLRGLYRWIPAFRATSPLATGWDDAVDGVRLWLNWMRAQNIGRFYLDGRNVLDSPLLSVDGGAGVASGWTAGQDSIAPAAVFSIDSSAQRIATSGNTSGATRSPGIEQLAYGVKAGDTIALSAEYQVDAAAGGAAARLQIDWLTSGNVVIARSESGDLLGGAFARAALVATAPATADRARIRLAAYTPVGGSVTAWFRQVMLERKAAASSTFIDNPGYVALYLVEPLKGLPTPESDFTRSLPLLLQSADGSAVAGF